jgi:hypothetical protein
MEGNDGTQTLDTLLDGMPTGEQVPATPAPTADTSKPPAEPTPAAPAAEPDQPFQPDQIFGNAKQNAAFAKMRTDNSRMQQTLMNLGKALNIENYTDPDALLNGLNQQMLALKSQQEKIPLDILQRLDNSETQLAAFQKQQLSEQASIGFQKVKDDFKLTDKQLNDFASKLATEGKNPFTTPMDLTWEYKRLNYDDVIKQQVDAAVANALARNTKAQTQSTKPSVATGPPQTGGKGVQSMADLDALLRQI